jgi:hypothetical protein
LIKKRADWLCYYFYNVKPWNPNCFADKRDVWVKIYGIPLHAWGESCFKGIGRKYGEFLDYDENTTSRASLDVARIKISTTFGDGIDDSMLIMALGVTYKIWIVEDKGEEQGFRVCNRREDNDQSVGEYSVAPGDAMEVNGGIHGGTVEGEGEDDEVDHLVGQNQVHGDRAGVDGEVSLDLEDRSQQNLCVSEKKLDENMETNLQNGVRREQEVVSEEVTNEALGKKVCEGEMSFSSDVGPNEGMSKVGGTRGLESRGQVNGGSEEA